MSVAVFLDKDGTLIEDVPFNVDPALIRLSDGAGPALAGLQRAGFRLLVISNQSGVAQGRFPETALAGVAEGIQELLSDFGVTIDGYYWCPHAADAGCACRKPAPGLIRRAGRDHGIDLERSWFIGDILDDVEAGRRAGCQTILLDNGHETEWRHGPNRSPHFRVASLGEAARVILDPRERGP